MGAVIATSVTLRSSARESIQAVSSIALGGAIGVGAHLLGGPAHQLVVIALAVALGVMVAGWPKLGPMGAWVPTSALFTLVIGKGELYYVAIYAGLTLLGALIGIVVTALVPQLPLAPAQEAMRYVRAELSDQIRATADVLDHASPPDPEDWARHLRDISPLLRTMRANTDQAREAARSHPRARRYADELATIERQTVWLDRTALLIQALVGLLQRQENSRVAQPALGKELRPAVAEALRRLAEAIDSVSGSAAGEEELDQARMALSELILATDRSRLPDVPGGGTLTANTIITTISRCLSALEPSPVGD
jgi:uncharacterized membrane protein YgaE (UPF0421/DUF939 family)